MATGLNGSFEITGTKNITGRISWSETYDIETNAHIVSITKFEVKSNGYYGYTYYPDGTIKVNDSAVITFDSIMGSHNVRPGLNTYDTVDAYSDGGYDSAPWESNSITGNSDGSCSVTISIDVSGWVAGGEAVGANGWKINGSQTIALTTIPRASNILSAGSVTIGNACNVKWTPLATSFYYKLKFSLGGWSAMTNAIHPNRITDYTYTGYVIPNDVAKQLPSATSGTMTVTLYTYSNSNCTQQIGSASSKTFTVTVPSSMIPIINSLTLTIDNSSNSVVKGWGIAVSGYTKVKIEAKATGSYGSTISSFTITGAYSTTQNGTSLSYIGGVISSSGNKTFNVVCKDSRGRTSSQTTTNTINFYAYSKPTITNFSVSRNSNDSTKVTVKADWSIASVNEKNSATAVLQYKKSTESTWKTYGAISKNTNTELSVIFDNILSYNFKVVVTDALSGTAQEEAFISTMEVLLDFRAGGKGIGIGKICESNSMEVSLDAKFFGNIYINGVTLENYIKSIINSS